MDQDLHVDEISLSSLQIENRAAFRVEFVCPTRLDAVVVHDRMEVAIHTYMAANFEKVRGAFVGTEFKGENIDGLIQTILDQIF